MIPFVTQLSIKKQKDLGMQQLLMVFLCWVCKFNFFPVLEKIGTKENRIPDFISRNHNPVDIDFQVNPKLLFPWTGLIFKLTGNLLGDFVASVCWS
jgi:hypothetical protein